MKDQIKRKITVLLMFCFLVSLTATAASASHGATIAIVNNCGYDLEHVMDKTCHGKFTLEPPKEIPNGAVGYFRVSPKSGASIGPKGWVKYKMVVNAEDGTKKEETFQMFWDHPVGSGKTRYQYSSYPFVLAYEQDPNKENPTGTEQKIKVTLKEVSKCPSTLVEYTCSH